MIADATRHMVTQGGTAGLGVPEGKSYLDAMADQSNVLLAQQITMGNSRVQEIPNLQRGQEKITAAQVELNTCVAKKVR